MKKSIKFHITGLEPDEILLLKEKLNNKGLIIEDSKSNQMYINITNPFNYTKFAESLNYFLSDNSNENIHELPNSCYFDADNAFIKCTDKLFHLRKKELLFLEMLFDKKSIVTYEQISEKLWDEEKDFTLNSLRLFIRDIKKKLPKNILTNVQGLGYKLTL